MHGLLGVELPLEEKQTKQNLFCIWYESLYRVQAENQNLFLILCEGCTECMVDLHLRQVSQVKIKKHPNINLNIMVFQVFIYILALDQFLIYFQQFPLYFHGIHIICV